MKKATNTIKTYTANVNVVNNNDLKTQVMHYALMAFAGLAIFYLLILMNMVWNIVERRSLEANARNLSSEVGVLELQYLTLADKVDVALSKEMGFLEVKPAFATNKSLGSLVKASNEI